MILACIFDGGLCVVAAAVVAAGVSAVVTKFKSKKIPCDIHCDHKDEQK